MSHMTRPVFVGCRIAGAAGAGFSRDSQRRLLVFSVSERHRRV